MKLRNGLPGGDRTPDPQLRRLLLYPTELRAEMEQKRPRKGPYLIYGRGDRIRTYDPLVPNQMRYQTALRPEVEYSNSKNARANHNAIYFINSVKLQLNAGAPMSPHIDVPRQYNAAKDLLAPWLPVAHRG